nr:reverse transcriptase domain-containing protein [Tanacetum cinerariifolium]
GGKPPDQVVKNWKALRTPTEVRSFLGLVGCYRRGTGIGISNLKDFVVYCDASRIGLGCVLMQRSKRRCIELFRDYDCEIRYHPGKAIVVVDALSRKERVKPKRVRAMNMILQSSIKDRILMA